MKSFIAMIVSFCLSLPIGVSAYEAYLPHITSGAADWADYLQVDNNSGQEAVFTLALYNSGTVIYSEIHTVAGLDKKFIDLKYLNQTAECGKVSFQEEKLAFRFTSENLVGGGVVEFTLPDTLYSSLGFYYSDFLPSARYKGTAVGNLTDVSVGITLYAVGEGGILGTYSTSIGPFGKLVGTHEAWFPTIDFNQLQRIIGVSTADALCGFVISSDDSFARLLFTTAAPVPNFLEGISYGFDEVETKLIAAFGEDNGFNALVLAADRGFSITQIVLGLMADRLQMSGYITGSDGASLTPRYVPSYLFPTALAAAVQLHSTSSVPEQVTLDQFRSQWQAQAFNINALFKLLMQGYSLEQIIAALWAGDITVRDYFMIVDEQGDRVAPERENDRNAGGLVTGLSSTGGTDEPDTPGDSGDETGMFDLETGSWAIVSNHPLFGDFDWYTFRFWPSSTEGHQGDGAVQVIENDTASGYYDVTGSQVFIHFTIVTPSSGYLNEEEYEGTFISADTIKGTWRKRTVTEGELISNDWVEGNWTGTRNY